MRVAKELTGMVLDEVFCKGSGGVLGFISFVPGAIVIALCRRKNTLTVVLMKTVFSCARASQEISVTHKLVGLIMHSYCNTAH